MLGPDTPCMVGAFDGAWSLLKQLTEEELAMAADPRFGGLAYSPERMDAMMAQGLDPAMAMGRLMKPASYYANNPDEYYDDIESGALTPEMSAQLYSDMAHGGSNQQVTAAPLTPAPMLNPQDISPQDLAAAIMAYQQMMGGR